MIGIMQWEWWQGQGVSAMCGIKATYHIHQVLADPTPTLTMADNISVSTNDVVVLRSYRRRPVF